MMADIDTFDMEPILGLERTGDGDVVVSVQTDDVTLRVNLGRSQTSVEELAESLRALTEEADTLVRNWRDRPDPDEDAFVFDTSEGYGATLSGRPVGSEFLSRDIACYALARAMEEAGYFPNIWWEDERGGTEPFHEQLSAFCDAGGDRAVPLVGVQYKAGDRVLYEGFPFRVEKDFGQFGVVLTDTSVRALVMGRDTITNLEEGDDDNG